MNCIQLTEKKDSPTPDFEAEMLPSDYIDENAVNLCADDGEILGKWTNAIKLFHLCAISPNGADALNKPDKSDDDDDSSEQDQLDDALREGQEEDIDEDLASIED